MFNLFKFSASILLVTQYDKSYSAVYTNYFIGYLSPHMVSDFFVLPTAPAFQPNCKFLIQYVYSVAIRGGAHSQAIMPDQSHISHSVGPERKRGRNRNGGKTIEATSRCMSSRAGIGGLYTYTNVYPWCY